MNVLLAYPFYGDLSPLCRFKKSLVGYSYVIPVCPRSFGFAKIDAGKVDGGSDIGVKITDDFVASLDKCKAVFMDYARGYDLAKKDYLEKIEQSLGKGKKVMISESLLCYIQNNITEAFLNALEIIGRPRYSPLERESGNLLDIPVPCISVLGAGDQTNKFDIQLGLRQYFSCKGYKVSQLGTKEYSSLFGFEALPAFLFESGGLREKILRLNHLIYDKVLQEKADLFIIGCPGGIMRHNPFDFEEYGELSYLIGNAVKADASVLSLYCAPYDDSTLTNFANICKYRDNADVTRINISCKDIVASQATMECKIVTVDVQVVLEKIVRKIGRDHFGIYVGLMEGEIERLSQSIELELLNNL